MNRFIIAILCGSVFGCATVQAAEASKAEPPKTEAKAEAKVETQKQEVKTTTTYKGRAGVAEFLQTATNDKLPEGQVVIEAKPQDMLKGSLDVVAISYASEQGRNQAAAALVMAGSATSKISDSREQEAWAYTTTATYEAWTVASNGLDKIELTPWTRAVMYHAGRGDKAATASAITDHADGELRMDRLLNPSWMDRLAFWWHAEN